MTSWAPVATAILAAFVALFGYLTTQWRATRERKRKVFAEAIAAVGKYQDLPYGRLRAGSTGPSSTEIGTLIQDIEDEIALHCAWLEIDSPRIFNRYSAFVSTARKEAASYIEAALRQPATTGADIKRRRDDDYPETNDARKRCIDAMRLELRATSQPWTAFRMRFARAAGRRQ